MLVCALVAVFLSSDGGTAETPRRIHGQVTDAKPEVSGADIDVKGLSHFIHARNAAIEICYAKQLQRDPTLAGKVVVRFTLTKTGRVVNITTEQELTGNDKVGSCVKAVVRAWLFPMKPETDISVRQEFTFAPVQ